jgi:phosphate-selective porin OprO/OprP
LLHVGLNVRYAKPKDGEMQLKARPEANPAPYFIDTGKFTAEHTEFIGPEIFYRRGPLLVGSEYYFMKADSPETGNPTFHGGDVVVTYLFTGEARSYSTRGGLFGSIDPSQPVFEGGPGAWELVLRASYIDTDGGTIKGGKMWRLSPLVAWHLSSGLRFTVGYGYVGLDRDGTRGYTHVLQSRLHFMF